MDKVLKPVDISMKYVNSRGNVINLEEPPFIGEKANDLFSYKWTYTTQGQSIQRIVKFDKEMIEKKFHVLISGASEIDYMNNLEKFLQLTDIDVANKKMGKLYIGEYYLECYIFASTKPKKYLYTTNTLVQCSAICERGNWQKEGVFNLYAGAGGYSEDQVYTNTGIAYPYDYPYDYSAPFGKNVITNESYMNTDFELTFHGAMQNPSVTIGGNLYQIVDVPIAENERIVINSQKKQALWYKSNGDIVNVFKNRNKEHYIYEQIKGGANLVIKDIDARITLKLFYERSEPKWSNGLWI